MLDFSDLNNKNAVITGGGGVLCWSFARALARKKVNVALLDLDGEKARDRAVFLAEEFGVKTIGLQCDVLSEEQLKKAKQKINLHLGSIHILVNGAGGNVAAATTDLEQFSSTAAADAETKTFYDLPLKAFKDTFDLNFIGTLVPTQVLSADMAKEQKGVIINISSMNAFKPLTKIPAYSAAKASVSNFTEWLAVHLAPAGIRVNAIAPGFFLTEQLRFLAFDKDGNFTPRYQRVIGKTPMRRLGEPDELQGTLLYLSSDISSFVTGVVIPVDGGFNASSGV